MSKEKDQLLDHDYDGIQEYDNPIPLWLSLIFAGSIIFSAFYLPYYHVFKAGPLSAEAYELEMQAAAEKYPKPEPRQLAAADANLSADELKAAGADVFASMCASCHGAAGEGLIGPSLVDDEWNNGTGSLEDVVSVVTNGVPAAGMPPWGHMGQQKVLQVSTYVISLTEQ